VPAIQDDRLLYTVPHAAQVLDLSKNTVWNLLRDGELTGVKVRNRRMIARAELERYAAALRGKSSG
jgi:excisionase family DNA binding protein